MKKLIVALFCIFTAGMAFGQEEGGRMGKMFIQPNFSYGFTYPGGEITVPSGSEEPNINGNFASSFGVNFGFFSSDQGAWIIGLAKQSKVLNISGDSDFFYNLDCITLQGGYRGYNGGFFWGIGLFYSSISDDSEVEKDDVTYKIKDYYTISSEFGLYFEIGGSIPVAETVTLDLGLKFEGALNNSIKEKNPPVGSKFEIRSRALMLNAGISIYFN